jgi:hypothetical protein
MIYIYLDENLSEYVADALNSLNKGYFADVQVSSTKISFGKGIEDEKLIPEIGKRSGILITRDINIHRTELQYELCKQHNLGVFFLSMPKNQNRHWEIVLVLIEHWEEIIRLSQKNRLPFAYRVKARGKMESLK